MNYLVIVPEMHYSTLEIEASSPEEAKSKVSNGEGHEISCDYAYTIGYWETEWEVREIETKK